MTEIQNVLLPILTLVLTVVNGWLVFVLRDVKSDLKDVRHDHNVLVAQQHAHELLMGRTAITRDEFRNEMNAQTLALKESMKEMVRNNQS